MHTEEKSDYSVPKAPALKRNVNGNYTEGAFFVTLNVRERFPILGEVVVHPPTSQKGADGVSASSTSIARFIPTKLGEAVAKCWEHIPDFYPNVELIGYQVMPEHFHGLMRLHHVKAKRPATLGRIIAGFMAGCTHAYWDVLGIHWREMRSVPSSGNISPHTGSGCSSGKPKELVVGGARGDGSDTIGMAGVAPDVSDKAGADSDVGGMVGNGGLLGMRVVGMADRDFTDKAHSHSYRGPSLFLRGYNDVEVLGESELETKFEYLRSNVERRAIKQGNRKLFHIQRGGKSQNWNVEAIRQGLACDRLFACDQKAMEQAWMRVSALLLWNGGFVQDGKAGNGVGNAGFAAVLSQPVIDVVGDRELLTRQPKVSLICHRADAALFEKQKEAVINAARNGAVVVTACISPKEREVMRMLYDEQLPVIEVMNNGFSDRYKPSGQAFYACAERRRVELTPWRYRYLRRYIAEEKGNNGMDKQRVSRQACSVDRQGMITREMCMVMNQLVRIISGVKDDWWKGSVIV